MVVMDYDTFEGLIVTALEGGSNYWYYLPDLSMVPKNKEAIGVAERVARSVWFNKDASIPVQDAEHRQLLGHINESAVDAALPRMESLGEKPGIRMAASRIRSGSWDEGDADAWFQFVVMGKLVYG